MENFMKENNEWVNKEYRLKRYNPGLNTPIRAKIIAFEGAIFSGKTSIIKEVESQLKEKGFNVYSTFTPGGTSSTDLVIRELLVNKNYEQSKRPYKTERLLYHAAHLESEPYLLDAMKDKSVDFILCDRMTSVSDYIHGVERFNNDATLYDPASSVVPKGFDKDDAKRLYKDLVYQYNTQILNNTQCILIDTDEDDLIKMFNKRLSEQGNVKNNDNLSLTSKLLYRQYYKKFFREYYVHETGVISRSVLGYDPLIFRNTYSENNETVTKIAECIVHKLVGGIKK